MSSSTPIRRNTFSLGIACGIALIVMGIFAISMPLVSTLILSQFIGFLLLFSAVFYGVNTFQSQNFWDAVLQIALTAICAFSGFYLFTYPVAGISSLTIVLGFFFVLKGIVKLTTAMLSERQKGWGWYVMEGFTSLLVGYLIFNNFPESSAWAIGLLFGIDLMVSGLSVLNFTMISDLVIDKVNARLDTPTKNKSSNTNKITFNNNNHLQPGT